MKKTTKSPGEKIVKDIKRATRKYYSSEEKIRIALDGLRGEEGGPCLVSGLCRSLQKFDAVHASVYIHYDQELCLSNRANFKLNSAAALAEWRGLGAN